MRPRIGRASASAASSSPTRAERVQPARGDGEVDRPAALGARAPGVLAALVDVDLEAAPTQQRRQQAPGQPRSDDRDPRGRCLSQPRPPSTSAVAARHTSWWVQYSGAGASRTTSGSRASAITPCSRRRRSHTSCAEPAPSRTESWAPRRSGSRGVTTRIRRSAIRPSSSDSRYPVSRRLRSRSASMPTSSKIRSEASTGAIARIGGLDTCQESAVSTGSRTGPIAKRVASAALHHPCSLGSERSARCRSCTKAPATAPGPALTYL